MHDDTPTPHAADGRRLIEEWLPVAALGEESVRERRSMTALPPTYYLHVWWARRPLVASRAAILASILPADADRGAFLRVLGILGDPVKARERIAEATRKGIRLGADAYGYPRAFSRTPDAADRAWIAAEAARAGLEHPLVLDPTSGGGSIPFEALRLGLDAAANDLNPVAILVQKCTHEYPLRHGRALPREFRRIGDVFAARVRERLQDLFPPEESEDLRPDGYLFARTIRCPHCGGLIPLSPNWRLAPDGTGVRLLPRDGEQGEARTCGFEIVHAAADQSPGTVGGGRAVCPFPSCGCVADGDAVKRIAREGGMGEQLFAVVFKRRVRTVTKSGKPGREKWERGYRAPRPEDDVFDMVRARLEERMPLWEARDLVPMEEYPAMFCDRSKIYGVNFWRDLFSPRQLFCHVASVEIFQDLLAEERAGPGFGPLQEAAFSCLALSLDKMLNYNSRMTRWQANREVIICTFDRHDFSFKWSYAEMAPLIAGSGYDWAIGQTGKALEELVDLLHPDAGPGAGARGGRKGGAGAVGTLLPADAAHDAAQGTGPDAGSDGAPARDGPTITVSCRSGDDLAHLADGAADVVVMDPPYYDNVMYAELSDFFHVWLRRTAGLIHPDLFARPLTNKEDEAVANPAKFRGEKGPRDLAAADYRERMRRIFAECRRVLRPDGLLLLMFTHKSSGAWDALAGGLIAAGFLISASWPVNTEAEGSLHIRDKAAAGSTVFLACRPRPERTEAVFWEDLEPEVGRAVRRRVADFRAAGISGIDLLLAGFGPALEVFSRAWPVRRGMPEPEPARRRPARGSLLAAAAPDPWEVTPEDVLSTARAAVKESMLRDILRLERPGTADALTDWCILAWHIFRAPRFPYDEALNLARVAGLDMEDDVIGTVAGKTGGDVVLWDSAMRAARSALGPADGSRAMIDALHRLARTCHERGTDAARKEMEERRLNAAPDFLASLRALLEVLPDDGPQGDFRALEDLRLLALADDVPRPRRLMLDLPGLGADGDGA